MSGTRRWHGVTLGLVCALPLWLSGCAALPVAAMMYAPTALAVGYFAYAQYTLSSGGEASVDIERSDPSLNNVNRIKQAKSLAAFPHQTGSDGIVVDTLRANTDLSTVSSGKTVTWVTKNAVPSLASMSSDEKQAAVARLARANGASLGLLAELEQPKGTGSLLSLSVKLKSHVTTTLVHAKTGETLWHERHQIVVKTGAGPPTPDEINRIIYRGIASRIMDIRTGREPQTQPAKGGIFDCGGALNFSKECKKEGTSG